MMKYKGGVASGGTVLVERCSNIHDSKQFRGNTDIRMQWYKNVIFIIITIWRKVNKNCWYVIVKIIQGTVWNNYN